jgi:hypothetical protein
MDRKMGYIGCFRECIGELEGLSQGGQKQAEEGGTLCVGRKELQGTTSGRSERNFSGDFCRKCRGDLKGHC